MHLESFIDRKLFRSDTSKIFVCVGFGFFVEFTLPEALHFIEKKCNFLTGISDALTKDAANVKAHIKLVLEVCVSSISKTLSSILDVHFVAAIILSFYCRPKPCKPHPLTVLWFCCSVEQGLREIQGISDSRPDGRSEFLDIFWLVEIPRKLLPVDSALLIESCMHLNVCTATGGFMSVKSSNAHMQYYCGNELFRSIIQVKAFLLLLFPLRDCTDNRNILSTD